MRTDRKADRQEADGQSCRQTERQTDAASVILQVVGCWVLWALPRKKADFLLPQQIFDTHNYKTYICVYQDMFSLLLWNI